jgi:hypothetical protein
MEPAGQDNAKNKSGCSFQSAAMLRELPSGIEKIPKKFTKSGGTAPLSSGTSGVGD